MTDPRRVRQKKEAAAGTGSVVYVMAREQRVNNNWALLYAAELAEKHNVSLVVLFAMGPMFNSGSRRHNDWMIASLQNVEKNLNKHQVPFTVVTGEWADSIPQFVSEHDIHSLVFDFNPLQPVRGWRDAVIKTVDISVHEVDARNVVPCWVAIDKAVYAARTFRPKIKKYWTEFAGDCPKFHKPSVCFSGSLPKLDWEQLRQYRSFECDAPLPDWITPGEDAAQDMLQEFLEERLNDYDELRNDPVKDCTSRLSAYLRWGNISAQQVVSAVESKRGTRYENKAAFLEELVVRRELTDNYVYYTKDYDKLSAAADWAQESLKKHTDDEREYVYTFSEFEEAKTHDELWNAAQMQMVQEGRMHGYMRMYWAKKILEWTNTPEYAIEVAMKLNDRYQLDGRDSNGVVGVMWSICGIHDQGWAERPVFGKIRYMNYNGAKRKFDVDAYVEKYTVAQDTMFHD